MESDLKSYGLTSTSSLIDKCIKFLRVFENVLIENKLYNVDNSLTEGLEKTNSLPVSACYQLNSQNTLSKETRCMELKKRLKLELHVMPIKEYLTILCIDSEDPENPITWNWFCNKNIPELDTMRNLVYNNIFKCLPGLLEQLPFSGTLFSKLEISDEKNVYDMLKGNEMPFPGRIEAKEPSSEKFDFFGSRGVAGSLRFRPDNELVGPNHPGFGMTTPFRRNAQNKGPRFDDFNPFLRGGDTDPDHEPVFFGHNSGIQGPFF